MQVTRPHRLLATLPLRTPTSTASQLIQSAQKHIPAYGFTHAALRAGIPPDVRIDDWTLNNLFPGGQVGETSIPVRLFRRWDHEQKEGVLAQNSPNATRGGSDEAVRQGAAAMLEARLRLSEPVKQHLQEPLSQLSALQIPAPLRTLLTSRLPIPLLPLIMPSAVPNPLPLIERAFGLADDLLHAARTRQQPHVSTPQAQEQSSVDARIPIYGTTWYTTRIHLAMAYIAAELHLISPASTSVDHSVGILYTILDQQLHLPDDPDSTSLLASAKQWVEWGGRGWVGILRSKGM